MVASKVTVMYLYLCMRGYISLSCSLPLSLSLCCTLCISTWASTHLLIYTVTFFMSIRRQCTPEVEDDAEYAEGFGPSIFRLCKCSEVPNWQSHPLVLQRFNGRISNQGSGAIVIYSLQNRSTVHCRSLFMFSGFRFSALGLESKSCPA